MTPTFRGKWRQRLSGGHNGALRFWISTKLTLKNAKIITETIIASLTVSYKANIRIRRT